MHTKTCNKQTNVVINKQMDKRINKEARSKTKQGLCTQLAQYIKCINQYLEMTNCFFKCCLKRKRPLKRILNFSLFVLAKKEENK